MSCLVLLSAAPPPSPYARLRAIVAPVSAAQMKRDVGTLVSFGTRHTLSSQTDPKRGIGAALNWAEIEFGGYSAACGNCLEVRRASHTFTGVRVLPHIRVDDWVFGVSSVSKDGFEGAVASAVPGGASKPYVPPPPPVK
jgi:hypothetical protein